MLPTATIRTAMIASQLTTTRQGWAANARIMPASAPVERRS